MPAYTINSNKLTDANAGDLLASAARTASGGTTGGWVNIGDARDVVTSLVITAFAGTTPTLVVKLQTSVDATDANAVDIPSGAFASQNTTGVVLLPAVTTFHGYVRAVWTITGSAGQSFTFSVAISTRD